MTITATTSWIRRAAIATVAAAAALAGAFTLAGPASASSSGTVTGTVYGSTFDTEFDAHGVGSYLYYVRVTADKTSSSETELDFPMFTGCHAHVQLFRSGGGANFDSPAVPCGEFTAKGASEVLSIYGNVPTGKYCTTIWIDNNGVGYANGNTACFQVKGAPKAG
jgi:hypothetical protein